MNVDVPIVGFYVFAPYLVVLAHFNLLLQLQLLSRKLFAFDAAVPQEENIGGLRGRLHIFPYTFYLVGRPPLLVRRLLGLMVSITLLLLPFITLIALQLWFLAYQSEVVTWWQRIAIWCDILMVTILWPIILHPRDNWKAYWREILTAHIPRRRVWIAFGVLLFGQLLVSFSATSEETFRLFEKTFLDIEQTFPLSQMKYFLVGYLLLLLSPPALVMLCGWENIPNKRKTCLVLLFLLVMGIIVAGIALKKHELIMAAIFAVPCFLVPLAMFWHPLSPRGSLALLLMIYIGPLLPLTLHIDGELIERLLLRAQRSSHGMTVLSRFLEERRRLDLTEQVLLAKPASPQTLTFVRSGEEEKALQQTEPININNRKLRRAQMHEAVLIGASLREVDIKGAYLAGAHLHGASFYKASLQGAVFKNTNLQKVCLEEADLRSAYLGSAGLQGANMRKANLQGSNLTEAHLQGADLTGADLQGAILSKAHLQGANLKGAYLQGADLSEADLQGADLTEACLLGADLSKAKLHGASIDEGIADLVDIRNVTLQPMGALIKEKNILDEQIADAKKWIEDEKRLQRVLNSYSSGSSGDQEVHMHSCLATPNATITCENRYDYDPEEKTVFVQFKKELHYLLGELACASPHIAWGIIQQIPIKEDVSSRQGLREILNSRLDDNKCEGLQKLRQNKKKSLELLEPSK